MAKAFNVTIGGERTQRGTRSLTQFEFRFDRTWNHLAEKIKGIPRNVLAKMTRTAVKAGAKPVRSMARRLAPVHRNTLLSGQLAARGKASYLRKSIITKLKTYPTGNSVAVVGPRKETKTINGVKKNPSNYAHLVELGHDILEHPYRSQKGAPVWAQVRPRPFIKPAIESNRTRSIAIMWRVYEGFLEEWWRGRRSA